MKLQINKIKINKKYIGKRVEVSYNISGNTIRLCDNLKKILKFYLLFNSGCRIKRSYIISIKLDPYYYLYKEVFKEVK